MPSTGRNRTQNEKLLSIRLSPDGLSFWTTAPAETVVSPEQWPMCDYRTETEERFIPFSGAKTAAENVASAIPAIIDATGTPLHVALMPDTQRTVVVPGRVFDNGQTDDYLRINNLFPTTGERVAVAGITGDYPYHKAIIVCDAGSLEVMERHFGNALSIRSPFEVAARIPYKYFGKPISNGPAAVERDKVARRLREYIYKPCSSLYLTGSNVYIVVQFGGTGEWRFCETLPYSSASDLQYYMQELSTRFAIGDTPLFVKGLGAKTAVKGLKKTFKRCVCEL